MQTPPPIPPSSYSMASEMDSPLFERRRVFSGYVKGWVITDLIFCILRILAVFIAFSSLSEATGQLRIANTVDIITGCLIVLVGLPANILLLNKNKTGLLLGWLNVLATILSIGGAFFVFLWMFHNQEAPEGIQPGAYKSGFLFGGLLAFAIRVAFLIFYGVALKRADGELKEMGVGTFPVNEMI